MTVSVGVGWIVFWIVASVAALALVDQALLWMERREWIYWRRRKGTAIRPGLARVSLELQTLLEPEKRYVLALKREEKTLQDDAADPPPSPGEEGGSNRTPARG